MKLLASSIIGMPHLYPATPYRVYLVFKTDGGAYGFDYQTMDVVVELFGVAFN